MVFILISHFFTSGRQVSMLIIWFLDSWMLSFLFFLSITGRRLQVYFICKHFFRSRWNFDITVYCGLLSLVEYCHHWCLLPLILLVSFYSILLLLVSVQSTLCDVKDSPLTNRKTIYLLCSIFQMFYLR